jgi:hypothetical protein
MSTKESDSGAAPEPAFQKPKKLEGPLGVLWGIATSYGTSCVILFLLMGLTYKGTVDQVELGLVGAQAKYFDSIYWTKQIGPLAIPVPGALLLQAILAVNLLCGGMVRLRMKALDWFALSLNVMLLTLLVLRKLPGDFWAHFGMVIVAGLISVAYIYRKKSSLGIMIVHLAMAGLLVAGLVKFTYANSGFLKLWEGEQASVYVAFYENELVFSQLKDDGTCDEFIVHDEAFTGMGRTGRGVVEMKQLPFKLLLNRFLLNCEAQRNTDGSLALVEQPEESQVRANFSGLRVTAEIPGQAQQSASLWLASLDPWTLKVGEETWTVAYRRRIRDLPWTLRLDKFIKEEHPGVTTPKVFASDVTRIDDRVEQGFHISMNAPMRYGGFTFSQNNWGPQIGIGERPDPQGRQYSTLEVSTNPSDQWPKYCCFVMAFGLFIHFLAKLTRFVSRSFQS